MPMVSQAYLDYLEQQIQQMGSAGSGRDSVLPPPDVPAPGPNPPTTAPYGPPSQGGPGSYPNTGGPQVTTPAYPPYLESPTYTPAPGATPGSSPISYQPDPTLLNNPFQAAPSQTPSYTPPPYDPSTNPYTWAPTPETIPYEGVPAPGSTPGDAYPGSPQQYYDPSQPDLNVPFGSAGTPGAPNLTPSPYAVAAATTLPVTTMGLSPTDIGSSGMQNAVFHGIWGGHHPMDYATWNAGAGTDQNWAARVGGTYANYLSMWYAMRQAPGSQMQHQQGGGAGIGSGQQPGGAGRPSTSAT